jgi:hypothetical protein
VARRARAADGLARLEKEACGAWLVRFAPGVSRRSNSANPTRPESGNIDADINACEAAHRARGLPALYRLPDIIAPAANERLARLNSLFTGLYRYHYRRAPQAG